MSLPVVLRVISSHERLPERIANFGIGTLVPAETDTVRRRKCNKRKESRAHPVSVPWKTDSI